MLDWANIIPVTEQYFEVIFSYIECPVFDSWKG